MTRGDKIDAIFTQLVLLTEVMTGMLQGIGVLAERLSNIEQKETTLMASAQEVVDKLTAETGVVQGVKTLMEELAPLIRAGKTDSTKLDEALALIEGNDQVIAEAVAIGTAAENEVPAARRARK